MLPKENNCQSQVSYVLNNDAPRLKYYSDKTGKYCTLFQEQYNETRANKNVVNLLDAIKQTENKINEKVEKEWEKAEKEWEKKHKDDDKNSSGGRMPPPPPK